MLTFYSNGGILKMSLQTQRRKVQSDISRLLVVDPHSPSSLSHAVMLLGAFFITIQAACGFPAGGKTVQQAGRNGAGGAGHKRVTGNSLAGRLKNPQADLVAPPGLEATNSGLMLPGCRVAVALSALNLWLITKTERGRV